MYRTNFGTLWEKAKVGCLEGTALKHVYSQGIAIFLYLLSQESFFHDTILTNERNIIKSIGPVVVQVYIILDLQ